MLYIVATPIGNLKDVTYRAIEVLQNCDYIACEDTRTSLTFLQNYGIDKKLVSYHKFNESSRCSAIAEDVRSGKDVAIISDAGMPGISDPGNVVVKYFIENNLPYTVIPGPSALINAFVLSGMDAPFTFVGFLPDKKKDANIILNNIKDIPYTTIFYVSPHSIQDFFDVVYKAFGDRRVCVVRELTKKFEEVSFTSLHDGYNGVVKGEFVVVVEGKKESLAVDEDVITEEIQSMLKQNSSTKDIAVLICDKYNLKKNYVYDLIKKQS